MVAIIGHRSASLRAILTRIIGPYYRGARPIMGHIRRRARDTDAMETIGPSSEDEMVAAFLRAEVAASRYQSKVRPYMARLGVTETMIEEPDFANDAENELRSSLLTAYRGWRNNEALFERWPAGLVWSRVELEPTDAQHIRYANASEWEELSDGTWMATDGARRIAARDPRLSGWRPDTLEAIIGIRAAIEAGESFPPIIAIGVPSGRVIILVEGHARMTAYLSLGFPDRLGIIYGAAPLTRLQPWCWCPPSLR